MMGPGLHALEACSCLCFAHVHHCLNTIPELGGLGRIGFLLQIHLVYSVHFLLLFSSAVENLVLPKTGSCAGSNFFKCSFNLIHGQGTWNFKTHYSRYIAFNYRKQNKNAASTSRNICVYQQNCTILLGTCTCLVPSHLISG